MSKTDLRSQVMDKALKMTLSRSASHLPELQSSQSADPARPSVHTSTPVGHLTVKTPTLQRSSSTNSMNKRKEQQGSLRRLFRCGMFLLVGCAAHSLSFSVLACISRVRHSLWILIYFCSLLMMVRHAAQLCA